MPNNLTPSVLIVDGDQQNRQIVQAALASQSYNTETADDIAAAIWTAANRQNSFDLLVCDCVVGQQTGVEIVEAIRSVPRCIEIPVLFMSSNQTPDVVLRRYDSISSYHIKKPLDIELLLELADRSLWMPHLVNSHIEKYHEAESISAPHAPFSSVAYPSTINTTSFVSN